MSKLQEVVVLNQVRAEVATAYARTHARFAQIGIMEQAVKTSTNGFAADLKRTKGLQGLPIEVLDSLRLLGQSRLNYLQAITDYNRAQFDSMSPWDSRPPTSWRVPFPQTWCRRPR